MKDKTPLEDIWDVLFVTPVVMLLAGVVGVLLCLFGVALFFLGHQTLAIFALVIGALAIAFAAWLYYKA